MRNAIAVLTRGYTEFKSYDSLIKRNLSIQNNLTSKNVDVLIFHEGNIVKSHQKYIQGQTLLPLRFIELAPFGPVDNVKFYPETKKVWLGV
ncbi:hypothetical protein [Thiorhodovibrio winogradskyi]|uniref:hypothetical protein n=1 Tax=Thiorhodovibrio winogradskyi TaxID=77007 RepID=UPI002E2D2442|nr:hypothetical protein [Thiorhodovibrio winogradskyi]